MIEFMTDNGVVGVPLDRIHSVIVHEDDSCTFVLKPQYTIKSHPFGEIDALVNDLSKAGIKVTNGSNDVVVMED